MAAAQGKLVAAAALVASAATSALASGPDHHHRAVVTSGACAGVNVYYQDHPCSWRTAITWDTPPTAYGIERIFQSHTREGDRMGAGRYAVRIIGPGWSISTLTSGRPGGTEAAHYANRVGRVVAQWPRFLRLAMPYDVLITDAETGGYFPRYCNRALNHSGCGDVRAAHVVALPEAYYNHWHDDEVVLSGEFEELMLHEIGHVLMLGSADWWRPSAWRTAVARDADYITEYAQVSEDEDFAESFVAWILWKAYRDRLTSVGRENIERITHRLRYFNARLFGVGVEVSPKPPRVTHPPTNRHMAITNWLASGSRPCTIPRSFCAGPHPSSPGR